MKLHVALSLLWLGLTLTALADEPQLPPVVTTSEGGAPIRAYGDLFLYTVSPDFQPHNTIQKGNPNPRRKIQPKKSWEIGSNYFGATPPRVPRTAKNYKQFQLPINLIDGNPKTFWASRGQGQPNIEPEWIRLDFPQDRVINEIVLTPIPS